MNKPTTIPYCNNFANKNEFSNNASTQLAHKCLFFAHWFFLDMKYWPTTHSWHATLHFHLLVCFCKLSNLGTKSLFLHLISLHTLLWTIINFPSHLTITSIHGNFTTHISWKTWFNSHSFFLVFSLDFLTLALDQERIW